MNPGLVVQRFDFSRVGLVDAGAAHLHGRGHLAIVVVQRVGEQVLPAPLGPMTAVMEPGNTSNPTPVSALTPQNARVGGDGLHSGQEGIGHGHINGVERIWPVETQRGDGAVALQQQGGGVFHVKLASSAYW